MLVPLNTIPGASSSVSPRMIPAACSAVEVQTPELLMMRGPYVTPEPGSKGFENWGSPVTGNRTSGYQRKRRTFLTLQKFPAGI